MLAERGIDVSYESVWRWSVKFCLSYAYKLRRSRLRPVARWHLNELSDHGYLAMGGQIVDAIIVPVPNQRNTREESERIKAGKPPGDWDGKPHKKRQRR